MTYLEKKPGFRRTYTLGSETLVIEGKRWLGSSYRQEFNLKKVKPEPDEHRMKDDTLGLVFGMPGLVIFMMGLIGSTVIYEKSSLGFYVMISAGLAAMIYGFIWGGRMRVLLFKSCEEVPLFDIACRSSRTAQFDAFVGELKSRIRAAKVESGST